MVVLGSTTTTNDDDDDDTTGLVVVVFVIVLLLVVVLISGSIICSRLTRVCRQSQESHSTIDIYIYITSNHHNTGIYITTPRGWCGTVGRWRMANRKKMEPGCPTLLLSHSHN